jgi:hypothetical protein
MVTVAEDHKTLADQNKTFEPSAYTVRKRSAPFPNRYEKPHHARLARRSANRRHYRRGRIPSWPLLRTPSRGAGTSGMAEKALE